MEESGKRQRHNFLSTEIWKRKISQAMQFQRMWNQYR